jgi:hypothetical protein
LKANICRRRYKITEKQAICGEVEDLLPILRLRCRAPDLRIDQSAGRMQMIESKHFVEDDTK